MTVKWGCLPLLPLRCILDHLSTEDALAATSTCHHWRNALMLYSGRRENLKLEARNLEKCLFLSRIFSKRVRQLQVHLNGNEKDLDKLMTYVMPLYFDTAKLQEIIFVGPSHVQQTHHTQVVALKRIVVESLIYKHSRSIKLLAIFGCEMEMLKNEETKLSDSSKSLCFKTVSSPADKVLSRCNIDMLAYSSLKHIIIDYDQVNTESLVTVSQLHKLTHLSLVITNKKLVLPSIDWPRVNACFRDKLNVALNLMALPIAKLKTIMQNVLVEDMPLTSFKVMFCRTIYPELINHVARTYELSLREFVWADTPFEPALERYRLVKPPKKERSEPDITENANCFILLCWQCLSLERLVIHGYWIWHYNLIGFLRLRSRLTHLEVSSVFSRESDFDSEFDVTNVRVLATDQPPAENHAFIDEIKEQFSRAWRPSSWRSLPPGLRASAPRAARDECFLAEAMRPLGVT